MIFQKVPPNSVGLTCFTLACALALSAPSLRADVAGDIRSLTGAHTRLVWQQDPQSADEYGKVSRCYLYGFDTDDGKGQRKILPDSGSYQKPLLTTDGKRILYTDFPSRTAYVVGFDGTGKKALFRGQPTCLRNIGGKEWVYVRTTFHRTDTPNDTIIRYNLDNPAEKEIVWSKSKVDMAQDQVWFTTSADGSKAYATWPWGKGGLATLPNVKLDSMGGGCWPSMSPDNNFNWFMLQGGHGEISMGNAQGERKFFNAQKNKTYTVKVKLGATIPYPEGYTAGLKSPNAIYWPRWTNHPDFMVLGGPQEVKAKCEVWLGKFNANLDSIQKWVRVTHNQVLDYFPDAWIDHAAVSTVPAPAFTPASDRFTGTLSVTLASPMEGAAIRYTSDGSDPGISSTLYAGPISLSATTTIKARAFKQGMSPSVVSSKTYTKVSSLEFTTLALGPASATVAQGGVAAFSAQALDQFGTPLTPQPTVAFSVSGGGTITASGQFTSAAGAKGAFEVTASATVGGVTKTSKSKLNITDAALVLLSPVGGEKYKIGDTLHIRWSANLAEVQGVMIDISLDGGATWNLLTTTKSVTPDAPDWADFKWVVPATMGAAKPVATISGKCLIRVLDYFQGDQIRSQSAAAFSIGPANGILALSEGNRHGPGYAGYAYDAKAGTLRIALAREGRHTLRLLGLDGRLRAQATGDFHREAILSFQDRPGIYQLRIAYPDGTEGFFPILLAP